MEETGDAMLHSEDAARSVCSEASHTPTTGIGDSGMFLQEQFATA